MIEMNKTGDLDVGQVIFEYNPKTKSSWIHVGNDWWRIFEASFVADNKLFETRKKYLMSLDNGKTYQTFNLDKINKALLKYIQKIKLTKTLAFKPNIFISFFTSMLILFS